jgi:hypothetical protein
VGLPLRSPPLAEQGWGGGEAGPTRSAGACPIVEVIVCPIVGAIVRSTVEAIVRPVVDEHGKSRLRLDWRIQPYDIEGYRAPEME